MTRMRIEGLRELFVPRGTPPDAPVVDARRPIPTLADLSCQTPETSSFMRHVATWHAAQQQPQQQQQQHKHKQRGQQASPAADDEAARIPWSVLSRYFYDMRWHSLGVAMYFLEQLARAPCPGSSGGGGGGGSVAQLHALTLAYVELPAYQLMLLTYRAAPLCTTLRFEHVHPLQSLSPSELASGLNVRSYISKTYREVQRFRMMRNKAEEEGRERLPSQLRTFTLSYVRQETDTNDFSRYDTIQECLATVSFFVGETLERLEVSVPFGRISSDHLSYRFFPNLRHLAIEYELESVGMELALHSLSTLRLESLDLRPTPLSRGMLQVLAGFEPKTSSSDESSEEETDDTDDSEEVYESPDWLSESILEKGAGAPHIEALGPEYTVAQLTSHLRSSLTSLTLARNSDPAAVQLAQIARIFLHVRCIRLRGEDGTIIEETLCDPTIPTSLASVLTPSSRLALWHSNIKGRFFRALETIAADELVWQERVTLHCDTIDGGSGMASVVSSLFAEFSPSLPSHISPQDLLLTLHVVHSLYMHGATSPFNAILVHLQSEPAGDAMKQRFEDLRLLSERLFHAWLVHPLAVTSRSSFEQAVSPGVIARVFGILQLNAHRCATMPTSADASDASASSASALPRLTGTGVSLHLSMLEHDCTPNVAFTTEWVLHDEVPAACLPSTTSSSAALDASSTVAHRASSSLHASAGRTSTHTLVLSVRARRTIAVGESLAISYYPCYVRTLLRRTHLQRQFGFTCACATCAGRDVARSFYCCHPDIANASQRCSGLIQPISIGTSAEAFSCSVCARGLTPEQFTSEICRWEQRLLADSAEYKHFVCEPTNVDVPRATTGLFSLYPHLSHYLLARQSSR